MIVRAEVLRCDLCGKTIVVDLEKGPLYNGHIGDEHLKNVWMPNTKTHVCIGCKRKYTKGGGIVKDCRKEEQA